MSERRGSAAARGYGHRWRQARATYLLNHPLCVEHSRNGLIAQASVVDHIIPHKGNQRMFWDKDNWQPLCKSCHDNHKKRLEQSGALVGCDASGMPIDPNHHWRNG